VALAGHIDEINLLTRARKVVAILRGSEKSSTWMTGDYDVDFRNVSYFTYESRLQLARVVTEAVDWAEERAYQRSLALRRTQPPPTSP
jgi:hypothetical protein